MDRASVVQRRKFNLYHLAQANYNVIFAKILSIPASYFIYFFKNWIAKKAYIAKSETDL